MLIKVCGMREDANIEQVLRLGPDMMGMIFAPRSKRYVRQPATQMQGASWGRAKKVGVFVDADYPTIMLTAREFGLDCVQLHGHEAVDLGRSLKAEGLGIIRALGIAKAEDLGEATRWEGIADLMVLDTKTPLAGGSGQRFDWGVLKNYKAETPYLLSGGIGPESAEEILDLRLDGMAGIDLNSRFEKAPALKDADLLKDFMAKMRQ